MPNQSQDPMNLQFAMHTSKTIPTYSHLEDHPRTSKWLGSPIYKPSSSAIGKGSHKPILTGQKRSPCLLTTLRFVLGAHPPRETKVFQVFPGPVTLSSLLSLLMYRPQCHRCNLLLIMEMPRGNPQKIRPSSAIFRDNDG